MKGEKRNNSADSCLSMHVLSNYLNRTLQMKALRHHFKKLLVIFFQWWKYSDLLLKQKQNSLEYSLGTL